MSVDLETALAHARAYLQRTRELNTAYHGGGVHVHAPAGLLDHDRPLDDLVAECLPASHAALAAAAKSLFFSLPVAFDPAESVGPYLATADRDASGTPYRFLDMGALIATHAFGENDPDIVAAVLDQLPYAVERYAHSEYQTVLSLRMKTALARIAPAGTPRHFVVNTGAEAVENAIKSVLLNRVLTAGERDGGFIISFEGAFHGRTLGSLAVTQRKKARTGFPTFDWPTVPFPTEEPNSPKETARREERSLLRIWELLVSGRLPNAVKSRDQFRREIDAIDAFLAEPGGDFVAFVAAQRAQLSADVQRRARRVAAVLVEPVQGEGGVRSTTARFMRRLRTLTRIYEVPLVYDEVQAGWGTTGRLWAHEWFDLPSPPDVVIWAKKAQNGVLFVSDELATFFQEEKKFNTTWEGDSTGMVRLLAMLDKLDLAQVQRTSDHARAGLQALAHSYRGLLKSVRGQGVMLGFDVLRADLRDALRERAFRRGLILLPAGERTLRFYPRHDTEPAALDEALAILRAAVEDVLGGRVAAEAAGPNIRVGAFECPPEAAELLDVNATNFAQWRGAIVATEHDRYGDIAQYPDDVLRQGRRPLLQLPPETLENTIANPQSLGCVLRDRVSGHVVAYALGSPLEQHDEEGVTSDPHHGEGNTFYLHAVAVVPSVQNRAEIEALLLNAMRDRARGAGFEWVSMLIEAHIRETGPDWLRNADVLLELDNYLRSGIRFAYLQAPTALAGSAAPQPA